MATSFRPQIFPFFFLSILFLVLLNLSKADIVEMLSGKSTKDRVMSANHDLTMNGRCEEEIKRMCDMKQDNGYGVIGECMRTKLRRSPDELSRPCREEIIAYSKIVMQDPIDYMPELNKCAKEIESTCSNARMSSPAVISCLKKNKKKLSNQCKEVVTQEQILEARSIELDPDINAACHNDLNTLCPGVSVDDGKQKLCLMRKKKQLSTECAEKIFEREVTDAEDIRFNVALEEQCKGELKRFCSDAEGEYGQARKLSCLWEHQSDTDFSSECKGIVVEQTIEQEQDYRLDFQLRSACARPIEKFCMNEKLVQDRESKPSGLVLQCLKSKYENIKVPECKTELVRVIGIQANIWLADLNLAKACHNDAAMFCKDESTEKVNDCLRKNFKRLSTACQTEEFAEMKVESQDVRMKPELKKACKKELKAFCEDVPNDQAESLSCLQDNLEKEGMSKPCKSMVMSDMEQSSLDFRLKYGFFHACQNEIQELCPQASGGDVLACLKGQRAKVKGTCKKELKRIIIQQMEDIKTAPEIEQPCKDDIKQYCDNLAPEDVHGCLQDNYDNISKECQSAEGLVQVEQIEDIDLNPMVKKQCKTVLESTCKDVPNELGEVMRCLEDSMGASEMTTGCKKAVAKVTFAKNKDYNLNPILQKSCKKEFNHLDCSDHPGKEGRLECLIEKVDSIRDRSCQKAVRRKIDQRITDARNDPNIAKQCASDMKKFCSGEDAENIHDCLFSHMEELSKNCQKAEFKDQKMAAEAEEYNINPKIKKACIFTKNNVCKQISWAQGLEMLGCLEDHLNSASMTAPCRKQLEALNQKSATSIKLNPFLTKHCSATLQKFRSTRKCEVLDEGAKDNGKTLECLTQNYEDIKDKLCKGNVFQSLKVMVMDYKNKPNMEGACKADVQVLCDPATSSYLSSIECLKERFSEVVNKACKAHVEEVRQLQSQDWLLNPNLKTACAGDVKAFCGSVLHGKGRVLGCLKFNTQRLSENCAKELGKMILPTQPTMSLLSNNAAASGEGGLELKGWTALLGLAALVSVIVFGIYKCIPRSHKGKKAYTVVVNK